MFLDEQNTDIYCIYFMKIKLELLLDLYVR